MESSNKTVIVKDVKEKSVLVSREFNAPLADVWRAFTESELLDQWWGPQPWRAATKQMDFTVGGRWLYAMVGPQGEKHWSRMDYTAINPLKSFEAEDCFCDEEGNDDPTMPVSWDRTQFAETGTGTKVEFKLTFPTEAGLQKIVETGFEQGIAICFDQLETLLLENNRSTEDKSEKGISKDLPVKNTITDKAKNTASQTPGLNQANTKRDDTFPSDGDNLTV